MEQMIVKNINIDIKLKLNSTGVKVYQEFIDETNQLFRDVIPSYTKVAEMKKQNSEGYIRFVLHEVFNIFGSHCIVGAENFFDEMIIVNNLI